MSNAFPVFPVNDIANVSSTDTEQLCKRFLAHKFYFVQMSDVDNVNGAEFGRCAVADIFGWRYKVAIIWFVMAVIISPVDL